MTQKINLDGIDAIIFDLGGVIINLNIDLSKTAFEKAGFADFNDHFALGHADGFFKQFEIGAISDETFIDALKAVTPEPMTTEAIMTAWDAMLLDFPPKRMELLTKLAAQKRVFLYSNTNALHYATFSASFKEQFDKPLEAYFEKAYYSHIMGLRKPSVEGYDFIAQQANLIPENILFVDDAKVNVEGAIQAGWMAHWLQPGVDIVDLFDI